MKRHSGNTQSINPIFEPDEMQSLEVNPAWSAEELLSTEGIFFLKDITGKLEIEASAVKAAIKLIESAGKNPWQEMGVRKVWSHFIVRMTIFAPYYRQHLKPRVKRVNPDWNANTLLRQTGVFSLAQVAKRLPFTTHQLRYQAKQNPESKRQFGLWKDEKLNLYVVDMEPFSHWIKSLWEGNFSASGRQVPAG